MGWIKINTIAGALLLVAGCGIYSFQGNLPPHIKTLSIAPVVNRTSEYAATDLTNEEITNLFVSENIVRVVDQGRADSDLQVTIMRVSDRPSTYTETEQVQEWRIDVNTSVVWYDMANNKPLFEKSFNGEGYYPPGDDLARESALKSAVVQISQLILSEVVSTW